MQANPVQPQQFSPNIYSHQNARINPFQTSQQAPGTQVYHQRGPLPQATFQQGLNGGIVSPQHIGRSRITGNQQSRPVIISQPISTGTIQTGKVQTGAVQTGHIHAGSIQTGSTTTQHLTIPTAESLANKPPTSSRIEYIPYQKTYTDYETRQIVSSMWVPVQRKCLNYYAIENITEFLPKEIEDVRYEMVPEETINYRVQYVPIEKKIVHLPKDEQEYQYNINHINTLTTNNLNLANNVQTNHNFNNTGIYTNYYGTNGIHSGSAVNVPGFVNLENNRVMSASRTNYVTSDGYVPNFNTVIPTLPEGYTRTQNNTSINTSATPGFMNNPSFVEGLSSGYKQQQTKEKGPSFMNNPEFMSGLSSGFKQNSANNMRSSSGSGLVRGDSGNGLTRGDSFSGRDKPRETRISEKDSFGSEYDTYAYN